MNCATVDELAAAYALGAVEPDDERAIGEHLASCEEEHAEARGLIDAAAALPAAVEPTAAPAHLRERILATAAATPQEHRRVASEWSAGRAATPAPRPWWQRSPLASAAAAVALAVAVGVGAWNLTLQDQLASRDAVLRALAAADATYRVEGSAGSGWLIETDDRAIFVAADLAALPADRIYELWLIDADGSPVAVGTLDRPNDIAAVTLERVLGEATAFAVTVERERVDAPTSEPVLVASLQP